MLAPKPLQRTQKLSPQKIREIVAIQKRLFQLVGSCTAEHTCPQGLPIFGNIKEEGCGSCGVSRCLKAENFGIAQADHISIMDIEVWEEAFPVPTK